MFKGKYLFLLFGYLLTMEMLGIPSVQAAYQLVWSDEFDGSSLNTSNWTYETGGGGWGNRELQYYTAGGNCTVSGGILTITAKKENLGGYAYTSTRIRTKGLREFKYGKIEARLAVPKGQGLWPAFWMLGANFPNTLWPECGEIDIMEHINTEDTVYGTMHWDNGDHAMYGGSSPVSNMADFHIYSIEWTPYHIRWFVDDIQFWEGNIENSINSTEEFHKPFFMILNLAVGGTWPGDPDGGTVFPAQYQIDYVRVYQETIYVSKDGICSGNVPCFSDIQKGIASASGPSAIEITQETYDENIILDFDEVIALQGGWDTNFTSNSSYTTISGSITITNGKMTIERIIFK
jgi:beta-glucanase (GH16 family)